MHLEFAGLPGSGKSTLASALQKQLGPLGLKALPRERALTLSLQRRNDGHVKNIIKRLPPRLWKPFLGKQTTISEFATLSSRHLKFIAFFSETLAASDLPDLLIESIWNTTVRTFSEVQLVSRHLDKTEIAIMDEAFCQRCFTLFGYMEKSVPDELIQQYADLAPTSDHIVRIVTAPRVCVHRFMKRYRTRSLPHDFVLDEKELMQNFEFGNRILSELCRLLTKKGKTIYEINGQGAMEQSIYELEKIGLAIRSGTSTTLPPCIQARQRKDIL